MAIIAQTVKDAAEPLSRAVAAIDEIVGLDVTKEVLFKYRHYGVEVKVLQRPSVEHAARVERVWELLIAEFQKCGWGFHSRFLDGVSSPRTSMVFDHPDTLTRVR